MLNKREKQVLGRMLAFVLLLYGIARWSHEEVDRITFVRLDGADSLKLDSALKSERQKEEILRLSKQKSSFKKRAWSAPEKKSKPKAAAYGGPPINLNQATIAQLESLGTPTYLAKRIIKYRKAANGYYRLEQLKKIYGMNDTLYVQLTEHLFVLPPIDTLRREEKSFERDSVRGFDRSVDSLFINHASVERFKSLSGIGEVLSKRVVSYRDRLGGFVRVNQLKEVYGVDTNAFEMFKSRCFIRDTVIRYIFINTLDTDSLRGHPYLKFYQLRAIVAYREQHGRYASKDILLKLKCISRADYIRIEPYIGL